MAGPILNLATCNSAPFSCAQQICFISRRIARRRSHIGSLTPPIRSARKSGPSNRPSDAFARRLRSATMTVTLVRLTGTRLRFTRTSLIRKAFLDSLPTYGTHSRNCTRVFIGPKSRAAKKAFLIDFHGVFVDDSSIETENFLPNTFTFQLDQSKVLELLVGHTLYNNTNVILRELVQNSLDAVRLRRLLDQQQGREAIQGEIRIFWDSVTRALIVEDNGTGMSQEIIENHLLNVGASLYQDDEFQKRFPMFSPISRFGIGILSTFMVSDEVDILTCHTGDDHARELSIRSIHGRYLIRLIDKQSPEVAKQLGAHGTRVIVKLRPSARIKDVLE